MGIPPLPLQSWRKASPSSPLDCSGLCPPSLFFTVFLRRHWHISFLLRTLPNFHERSCEVRHSPILSISKSRLSTFENLPPVIHLGDGRTRTLTSEPCPFFCLPGRAWWLSLVQNAKTALICHLSGGSAIPGCAQILKHLSIWHISLKNRHPHPCIEGAPLCPELLLLTLHKGCLPPDFCDL